MEDDKDMYICRCEEVTLRQIEQVIDEGYDTLDDIKRITRAGMGLCQGRTCQKVIARIISQKTGKPIETILQTHFRFPVRPQKMRAVEEKEACCAQDC